MKKSLFTALALLLCLAMLLTGCSGNPSTSNNNDPEKEIEENIENLKEAKVSVWDGTIADSFSNGDGSQVDPYVIGSAAELAYVSKLCAEGHNFNGEFLELSCNINLNGLEWDPIGKLSQQMSYGPTDTSDFKDFQGIFNGNGYFVSNFSLNKSMSEQDSAECYGLFGAVRTATIKNLIVKNFDIMIRGNCGAVGGLAGGSVDTCYFENCHIVNGDISVYITGDSITTGGLIGTIEAESHGNEENCSTLLLDCSSEAAISISCAIPMMPYRYDDDGERYYPDTILYDVGGLVGSHYGTQSTTSNCFAKGSITVSTAHTDEEENALMYYSHIGGLMAYTNSAFVNNCYSDVDIFSEKDVGLEAFGGLIGMAEETTVTNCYSSGNLEIKKPKYHMPCSGLIGNSLCYIKNCFVIGKYTWSNTNKYSDFLVGRPRGSQDEYAINNCYVSNSCRIKEAAPENSSNKNYIVVDKNYFTNRDFILNKLGFEEKPAEIVEEPYAVPDYSGWVISDGDLPKMYYEDAIKEETVEVKGDIATFVGKKAEDAIAKFGTDYTMSGMSLYFSAAQISFSLGNYAGTLLGTEEIVAINIGGERDIGNGLNSSMTYNALKEAVKQDVPVPYYLEIDGTYIATVDVGKYIYIYTWSTENYDIEKCDYVSITKKN